MKAHELQLSGSKDRKRVGRGIGSGYGKTAGRGTKGQNSRSGGGVRIGFAGGQNPLAKLLPKKRGFRAIFPTITQVVNLEGLNQFKAGTTVDAAALVKAGLVKKPDVRVKLLGEGKLEHKLTVQVQAVSASAKVAIEQAGGTVELVELPKVPSKKATRPQTEAKSAS
jgi:large subunit ribosomal protein L15